MKPNLIRLAALALFAGRVSLYPFLLLLGRNRSRRWQRTPTCTR